MSPYCTTTDLARAIGCSDDTVRRALVELYGERAGAWWRLTEQQQRETTAYLRDRELKRARRRWRPKSHSWFQVEQSDTLQLTL